MASKDTLIPATEAALYTHKGDLLIAIPERDPDAEMLPVEMFLIAMHARFHNDPEWVEDLFNWLNREQA